MNLTEAIEERRARIAELRAELEQLELAEQLVAKVLAGEPMKPPPRARKERAMPVEKMPKTRAGRASPSKSTDESFGCGHPRSKENSYASGYTRTDGTKSSVCRLCTLARQKKGREPVAKSEPDPVSVQITDAMERSKPLVADALRLGLAMTATPGLIGAAPVNHVAVANAARWQRQCTMLDFETGRCCSLIAPHPMPHSASGRTFTTALDPAELGGTSSRPGREIDHAATSGSDR